jgi:hypothetical protein
VAGRQQLVLLLRARDHHLADLLTSHYWRLRLYRLVCRHCHCQEADRQELVHAAGGQELTQEAARHQELAQEATGRQELAQEAAG